MKKMRYVFFLVIILGGSISGCINPNDPENGNDTKKVQTPN